MPESAGILAREPNGAKTVFSLPSSRSSARMGSEKGELYGAARSNRPRNGMGSVRPGVSCCTFVRIGAETGAAYYRTGVWGEYAYCVPMGVCSESDHSSDW